MSRIRFSLDAPGGQAFFEWALSEHTEPRITKAVSRVMRMPDFSPAPAHSFGQWAENDWEMLVESLRRGGLHVNNPNTRDAIREAVGEWLVYRAERGLIPDGFEALEDYYWDYLR